MLASQANAYERPTEYYLASVDSRGGASGDQLCEVNENPAITDNGRFIAFATSAQNLDARDDNQLKDTYVHDTETGRTSIVSISTRGTLGEPPGIGLGDAGAHCKGGSEATAISSNGRYVAFTSDAVGLTSEVDLNNAHDVFLHDRKRRTTELLTRSSIGGVAAGSGGGNSGVSISADGRYVAFSSSSNDLAGGDPSCGVITQVIGCLLREQVYVYDRVTQKLEIATATTTGDPANGHSGRPSISRDGRWLAFESNARNLVDPNEQSLADSCGAPVLESWLPSLIPPVIGGGSCLQIYLRDLERDTTLLVSASDQGPANAPARLIDSNQAISGDGRFVTYASGATNLVPNNGAGGEIDGSSQSVFVYDQTTQRVERVSVSSAGEPFYYLNRASISANGRYVVYYRTQSLTQDWGIFAFDRQTGALDPVVEKRPAPSKQIVPLTVSGDGRYVAFQSRLRLLDQDANDEEDIYVGDRGPALSVAALTGQGDRGADRLTGLAPSLEGPSIAGDLTSGLVSQGADLIGASLVHRPTQADLLGVLELEDMPYAISGVFPPTAVVQGMRLEVGGDTYEVRAGTHLSLPIITLFKCADQNSCARIGDLEGGYGTTGERVVFSLPLNLISVVDGITIEAAEAWTSLGSVLRGPKQVLDRIDLSEPVP